MNSHADIQRRLSAYCSGELDAAEHALVAAHLPNCPTCRADPADMRTTLHVIRNTPEVEPPTWLKSRIMAHLREENTMRRSWLQRIWFPQHTGFPVKILALLIVCVSGYYLSHTVETELKQTYRQELRDTPVQQASSPAQPPVHLPVGQEKQEQPSAVAPPPAAVPQTAPQRERLSTQTLPQVPTAPAPATYAPLPPLKDQYSGKSEMQKSVPTTESSNRAQEMAPEKKMKSSRSLERSSDAAADRAAGAPSPQALPQAVVRLSMNDPAAASLRIHEAISRSGGNITVDQGDSRHRLVARIPASRQQELLERLEQLGRVTQHPATPPIDAQFVELIVQW